MGGEEVEDFVNCVVEAGKVDVDIQVAFVSEVGRLDAEDVVIFDENRVMGGGGGLEGEWALKILSSGWVVEVDGVGDKVGAIVLGRETRVVDAAGAEWSQLVFADGEKYWVYCGGLVGAAFSCEVLGEGQAGVCVKCDVIGASAVALVGSSAPRTHGPPRPLKPPHRTTTQDANTNESISPTPRPNPPQRTP